MRYQSRNSNVLGDSVVTGASRLPDWNWTKTTKSVIVTVQSLRWLVSLFKHNLNTSLLPLAVKSAVVLPSWTTSLHNPCSCFAAWRPVTVAPDINDDSLRVESECTIQQFLGKELCNDKSCQTVGLSGRGTVLAFSVISFSAVSRFLSPLTKLL